MQHNKVISHKCKFIIFSMIGGHVCEINIASYLRLHIYGCLL